MRRVFHRMLVGSSDGTGQLLRVFDPPWYRVDLWTRWYAARVLELVLRRPRASGYTVLVISGQEIRVRVVAETSFQLPNVPRRS